MNTKQCFIFGLLTITPLLSARVKCTSNLTVMNKAEQINFNTQIEYELDADVPKIVYENDQGILKAELLGENDQKAAIEYTILAKNGDGTLTQIVKPVLLVSFEEEGMVSVGKNVGDDTTIDDITITVRAEKL